MRIVFFLDMLSVSINFLFLSFFFSIKYTAFSSLMDNIEIIPVFGTSFTVYVPILMIIVALITLFDLFARILQLVGIESEESSVRPFSMFFKTNDSSDEMDAELLEKYKTGKAIIDSEIRQLTNQHEQLKKNRERNSVGSVSSTHSQDEGSSHQPFKILAPSKDQMKSMISTHSFGSGSRHSRDERDEDLDEVDLEFNNIHTKRNSYTALKKQDDSKYGNSSSIFASSISANNERDSDPYSSSTLGNSVKNPLRSEATDNYRPPASAATTTNTSSSAASSSSIFSSFGSKPKAPPATVLSTFNNNSANPKAVAGYSKLTTKPEEPAKKPARSTNIFSFDDDEDSNQNAGGRYSNF